MTIEKEYYDNGKISAEHHLVNGCLHNDNGPAVIYYNEDGSILKEDYYLRGDEHRDGDLPAIIKYYDNGKIEWEWYKIEGMEHRDNNKPSFIMYDIHGNITDHHYCVNGDLHNEHGPAIIGTVNNIECYYIRGKKLTKNAFLKKYLPQQYAQIIKKPKTYSIRGKKYTIEKEFGDTIVLKLCS